jgi:hypothetical protein
MLIQKSVRPDSPSVLVQVGSVERPTEIKTISQDGEVIEAE